MTRWGRATLLAFLVMTLIAPVALYAQAPAPTIATAELRLWPEYDDPGLLVIFSGDFATGTTVPLQAEFPISAGARNIQATYQDAAGTLINRPFEVADSRLAYELPIASFHIEYYVDRAPSGDERQITYMFEAPYAIDALRVAVQQPARASGFVLTPAAENTEQGTDGLTYHVFNQRNLAAGEKLEIGVTYTKTDTGLSAPQLAVTSTEPAPALPQAAATTAASASDWLPWVLIGVGVALLAGILVYWLLSRRNADAAEPAPVAARTVRTTQGASRSAAAPAPPKPLPTVPARPPQASKPAGPVAFCHNCGNALKPEDRFCSQCGTARRS